MGLIAWSVVAVGLLVLVGVVLIVWTLKKKKEGIQGGTNYRVFFITGAVMATVGLILMVLAFIQDYSFVTMMPIFSIGVVYLAIGLGNRDKWRKTSRF